MGAMKAAFGDSITVWEFLRNLWYRWEVIRVESSGGSIFIYGNPRRFHKHTQAIAYRAVRVAVYEERWWIRRSTLPSWYWRYFA